MGIGIRLVLFLILTAAIWGGDEWAQRKLLGPGHSTAMTTVNGNVAAVRKGEVREQRQTALDAMGVVVNFFVGVICFAPWPKAGNVAGDKGVEGKT